MPLEGEKLDELLSGFLDGQLGTEELKLIQEELGSRESVRKRLEDLRSLGADVKSAFSSSHASTPQLPTDFAARVIAEAQRKAVQTGLPDDHHVRLAAHAEIVQVSRGRQINWPKIGRIAGVVAATAAVLLLAIYLPTFFEGPSNNQLAVEPEVNSPGLDNGDPQLVDVVEDPDPVVLNPNYVSGMDFKNHMVFVVDIEMTKEALVRDELARILRDRGLLQSEPIVANEDLEKAIADTRMVVQPDDEGVSDAVIYFMRADIKQIGAALDEIYFNRTDFPTVKFDAAFDNPTARLMEKVARSTGMRFAIDQPFVAPISVSAEDSGGSPFPSIKPTGIYVSSSNRSKGFSGSMAGLDSGDLSSVMLIVRAPY